VYPSYLLVEPFNKRWFVFSGLLRPSRIERGSDTLTPAVEALSTTRARIAALILLTLGCVCAAALLARLPQDAAYHHFADARTMLGVPNALNVLSNVVQFGPAILIPAMALLFPPRYTLGERYWRILGWYAAAKVLEAGDGVVFAMGGLVSGHTLKHLAAAWACYEIARMVELREPVTS
jgi:hypothetical protein